MGIQGLTKYVESSLVYWKDIKLAGSQIVLDGSSLPYHLPGDFDWKFGGQYPAMRESLVDLLEALLAEGVDPIHVVFDGVIQSNRMDALLQRRQDLQDTIRKSLMGAEVNEYQEKNVRPPLMSETFRQIINSYRSRGVNVYPADGDSKHLAVCLAHTFDCFLVGENSGYFISAIKGYIPLSKLKWGRPGSAVVGKVFKRDAFIASLRIEPNLVYAIPALVGNEALPNLVDTTALKGLIRDNPRYRGKDLQLTIKFLQEKSSNFDELKHCILNLRDGREIFCKFEQSFVKAREQYKVTLFDNAEFWTSIAGFQCFNGKPIPSWIVKQYRDMKFSSALLDVLMSGKHFLRIIPDNVMQSTSMLISRSIRQDLYAFLLEGNNVTEIIRHRYKLVEESVGSSIYSHSTDVEEMVLKEEEQRQARLYEMLLCNAADLSLLHKEWHLPVASLVFWAKNAAIQQDDIYLKALVLCFVECFLKSPVSEYSPVFSLEALHLYAQWQCVYHDAILLNQVLALPLPYLSPADLFDGKRVTYYSQKSDKEFDAILRQTSDESCRLYFKILESTYHNMFNFVATPPTLV